MAFERKLIPHSKCEWCHKQILGKTRRKKRFCNSICRNLKWRQEKGARAGSFQEKKIS